MNIKNIVIFPEDILKIVKQQEFIGIRLSGGIDSAILCYIILKFFPDISLLPITFFNVRRPNARHSVDNVLKILKELNPNNKLMTQEIGVFDSAGYIRDPNKTNPKDIFQKQFIKDLFEKYQNLNFILSGETLNPPIADQELLFLGRTNEFLKERNIVRKSLLYTYSYLDKVKYEYSPFRNSNKKQIAELCHALNLFDTLFPYTETCESEAQKYTEHYSHTYGIEYVNPGIEPCQSCWPCKEKYWAYGVFDFNTKKRTTK